MNQLRAKRNLPQISRGTRIFVKRFVKGADALPLGEVEEGDAGGHEKRGDGGNRGTREDVLEDPARRIVIHPVVEPVVRATTPMMARTLMQSRYTFRPGRGGARWTRSPVGRRAGNPRRERTPPAPMQAERT